MEQTPIEWLNHELQKGGAFEHNPYLKMAVAHALDIEKYAIVQAYSNGWHDGQDVILSQVKHIDIGGDKAGEQYFNDTFKTEDSGE